MNVTTAVPERVRDWLPLRARGRGIHRFLAARPDPIHLGQGDTAFVTPPHVREAAKRAIDEGKTFYTDLRELRVAIADKLWRDNQVVADPDTEILVSAGCHALLFQIFATFVGPGDEVVIGSPGSYYHGNTTYQGGTPVEVLLHEERGFREDPAEIEAALTPRTKIIALTTPDGPVGAVHTREDLERIAELAIEHDLLVISDEIYEKINHGRTPHFSIASLPGMRERTITVNGFSKGYSMTGWRVGYCTVPRHLAAPLKTVNALNTIFLNTPAQYAALAALTGPQEPFEEMVAEYRRRMATLVEGLNAIDGIHCLYPDATYYAFPSIRSFGLTSEEFALHLLLTENVLVQAGTVFGVGGEGYIRTSCSAPEEEVRAGLAGLARAVERLREEGPTLTL